MKSETATQKKEIEIKLPVPDLNALKKKLLVQGFLVHVPRHHEFNLIFDTPEHHLRKSGRLLRLRRAADRVILTAKTPPESREASPSYKVREETEVVVADFNVMRELLKKIGLDVVFVYEKYREILLRRETMAMLDETPVGDYLEIEGSPENIDTLAGKLGYSPNQYITSNYRSLHMAAGGSGNMCFPSENG